MTIPENKKNRNARSIEAKLRPSFPQTDAYQHQCASIRVRVLDDAFHGKPEREQIVLPFINELPQRVQDEITILLLLAPEESKGSLLNLEFEQPTPSRL